MKIALIGYGKWGKIIFSNLKKISKNVFLIKKRSKINFSKKLDWIFISTQDQYHYQIAKFYLEKKVNVFCEKPVTRNLFYSKKLFSLAKKNGVQLIENQYYKFFENKIKLYNSNINHIYRQKKRNKSSIKDLLYALTYHDILLIYNQIQKKKKYKINLIKFKNNELIFSINFKSNFSVQFSYDLKKNIKKHTINNFIIKSKKNILLRYIKDVFSGKISNLENKKRSLFIIKTLNEIEKQLLKK